MLASCAEAILHLFGRLINSPVLLVLTLWIQGLDRLHHLWLVEAKVLGARDGGLGRRRERLALASARLDLVVDAAEDLRQEGFRV